MHKKEKKKSRARPGFEPGTSRTLSESHTPRPTSQMDYLLRYSVSIYRIVKSKLGQAIIRSIL